MVYCKNKNLVSVVMATYNGSKYVADQIESIINQSYKNIEIVVQDDCSSDNTVHIVSSYKDRVPIRLEVNQERVGFLKNFERGLSRAQGEFIALSDQDDIWHIEKLSTLLFNSANVDLVHSDCEIVDSAGNLLTPSWKGGIKWRTSVGELLFANDVTGCTVLLRQDLLKLALPFPSGLVYHDWWLAICAARRKGIRYINYPLVKYRQHAAQDTGAAFNMGSGFCPMLKRLPVFNRQLTKARSIKQLKNLNAYMCSLGDEVCDQATCDAISYHRSLSVGFFHGRAFMLALKRNHELRPGDRLGYIKAFLCDLFV